MDKKEFYSFLEHKRQNKWGDDYVFMEIEGKAVGRVYRYNDEKDIAYIEGLHVSEKERLKTIGGELFNKLLEKCKELGAKKIMLWCYKDEWVYSWYQKHGFEYNGDYQYDNDAVWMVKDLDSKKTM